jgi:hypothetical protein
MYFFLKIVFQFYMDVKFGDPEYLSLILEKDESNRKEFYNL